MSQSVYVAVLASPIEQPKTSSRSGLYKGVGCPTRAVRLGDGRGTIVKINLYVRASCGLRITPEQLTTRP